MNTYHIKSVYLKDSRIEKYFSDKDWKRADKKEKNVTLLYLDYLNIYDRKYWSYHSKIKNLIGEDKHKFTDKSNLDFYIQKPFTLYTYPYSIGQNLESFKNRFKKDKKYILKPTKGREGIGIEIVKNYHELTKFFDVDVKKIDFKGVKERQKWVIQEYLENPMLYQNRKFHLRVYFLIVDTKIYYFTRYLIITAAKEYKNSDFDNKEIHDSHYGENSIRNKIFPEDFMEKDYIEKINKDIDKMFRDLKSNLKLPMNCYPEDDNCYEVFAADIMITKTGDIKVLEFNHSVGYPESMDKRYPLFENGLDIVLNHYGYLEEDKMMKENFYRDVEKLNL